MSNRIIKVSIILIFMLFVTGLFNFCFAFEAINVQEYKINTMAAEPITLKVGKVSNLPKITENSFSGGPLTSIEYYTMYNNYAYLIYCNTLGELFLYIGESEIKGFVPLATTQSSICMTYGISKPVNSTIKSCSGFKYNIDTGNWDFIHSGNYSFDLNDGIIFVDGNRPFLSYNTPGDRSSGYAPAIYEFTKQEEPSISMKVVQTGTRTGHVEFIAVNWNSPHMYYIKDNMDELVRLIAEEELSIIHNKVKRYDGPVAIEYGEYVLGMLFDENGDMCFSQISDTVTIDYDSVLDTTHKLYLNKEDENIYYLSIHNYQDGDYIRVSNMAMDSNLYDENDTIILNDYSSEYNGLTIGKLYETALEHKNRKVTVNKNGITYFYLYDVNDTLVNFVVLNSSNYYTGEEYDFDVELNYGNCFSEEGILGIVPQEICTWVKVKPIINVPSIDNYELYFRIKDYGNIGYIQEEYRNIGLYHDNQMKKAIGFDTKNSPTNYVRIDDLIYDYFYIATNQDGTTTFTFNLELRSKSGQVIENKEFTVNLSEWNKEQGTVSSSTNGKDDTYIRNPDELSGTVSSSNKFDFSGLNNLSEQDLKTNVEGLIDSSIGFFGLFSTIFLLLPTWVSSLLYLFFFGMIIITLLRFIRGS